eukprot:gb/GEZN01010932.1/.p1 GENE.gb/GEZN01010932.1/~~gb/GEZN01010932.1/.p1  ORF type:complete len:225 (-),score=36.99 gb/GEZN01010932.1/:399-1073(-)
MLGSCDAFRRSRSNHFPATHFSLFVQQEIMAAEAKNYIDKVIAQTDNFLETVVYKKIPQLKPLVAKLPPPVKPAYVVFGAGALVVLIILIGVGANAFCNLVGFVYPVYCSFKALKSDSKEDDTQWLTYWIVYGFFNTFESITDLLLAWIPFYYLLKIVFLVWLMAPQTMGATMVYKNLIEPQLAKYESKVDGILKKTGEGVAAAAVHANAARRHLEGETGGEND